MLVFDSCWLICNEEELKYCHFKSSEKEPESMKANLIFKSTSQVITKKSDHLCYATQNNFFSNCKFINYAYC